MDIIHTLTQSVTDVFVNGNNGSDNDGNDCTQSSSPCLTIDRARIFATPNTSIVIMGTYTTGETHTNQHNTVTTHNNHSDSSIEITDVAFNIRGTEFGQIQPTTPDFVGPLISISGAGSSGIIISQLTFANVESDRGFGGGM